MRRFEFSDGKSNKFWEIAVDGESYTVRYGRMGTDGQTNTKVFPTPEKTQAEAEKAIRSKTKKGYAEVESQQAEEGGNAELEAQLHANPEDRAAWQVYADHLQGEGDPRGDLVAVHLALAESPDDADLKKREQELLTTHKKAFFGDLDPEQLEGCFVVEWGYGFWKRVKIGVDWDHEELEFNKLQGQVLRHASARFLQRYEMGLADMEGENYYEDALASLVKHGKRPGLRALHIGAFEYPDDTEISWTEVGDFSKIWAVLPDLEELQVTGGGQSAGAIKAPHLRKLFFESGGLDHGILESLAKASLPELEELELWLGTENYGGSCTAEHVRALLTNAAGFPKLRKLGLKNADIQDEICVEITKSPLLAQLESLDLSMGTMTEKGAQVLIENAGKLKHLKVLDISDNYVDKATETAFAKVFPVATTWNQDNPDDGYIYVSVGE